MARPVLFSPNEATEDEWQALHAFRRQRFIDDAIDETYVSDEPSREMRTRINPIGTSEYWQLREQGRVFAELLLNYRKKGSVDYETHKAQGSAWIGVLASERRKGHGTKLMGFLHERLTAVAVTNLSINARTERGRLFLQTHKGTLNYRSIKSRLDLQKSSVKKRGSRDSTLPEELLVKIYVGRVPLDVLKRLIPQLNKLAKLQPLGTLIGPIQNYDLTNMTTWYETLDQKGGSHFMVTIEKPQLNQAESLVAVSEAAWTPMDPDSGLQLLTAVASAYQGKGLGRYVKETLLESMIQALPNIKYVDTSNEYQNKRILRLNASLGFLAQREIATYQWVGSQLDHLRFTSA